MIDYKGEFSAPEIHCAVAAASTMVELRLTARLQSPSSRAFGGGESKAMVTYMQPLVELQQQAERQLIYVDPH